MKETINQRVARNRKLLDLTQQETAEKLGMKCSTYSQMERRGNISANMVLKLAAIFNISPDALLYGENQQKNDTDGNTLGQTPTPPVKPNPIPPLLLTNREENIIKILRTLSKEDKNEVIALIEKKYKGL